MLKVKNGTPFCVSSRCAIHISSTASLAKHLTSTLFVSRRQVYIHHGPTCTRPIMRVLFAWHGINGSPYLTTTFVAPSYNGWSDQTICMKLAHPPIRGSRGATSYSRMSSLDDTLWRVWSVEFCVIFCVFSFFLL